MAYFITNFSGLKKADSNGDGYSVALTWFSAYPSNKTNKVGINIYYSLDKDKIFEEGAKYVYLGTSNTITIFGFNPGESYYFAIRPIEYNPSNNPFDIIDGEYNDLKQYPSSMLSSDINSTTLTIPVLDAGIFPNSGVVLIGSELIRYSSKTDLPGMQKLNASERGANYTIARSHTVDGYDGGITWTGVRAGPAYYIPGEDAGWDVIILCQSRFEYPNFAYTAADGYRTNKYAYTEIQGNLNPIEKDLLNTNLQASDEYNKNFRMYDYVGYHRPDPKKLVAGGCIGSYSGGEMYCHDSNTGVDMVIRGISVQERMNQREEMLLRLTGSNTVLLKRMTTGIRCSCMTANIQYPDDRCPMCHGQGFAQSYFQYFNLRESDGRIRVGFDPIKEDIKLVDAGMDSENTSGAWTLTVPTINDRDVLIKYNQVDEEEWRYEVLSVTRTNTLLNLQGNQKLDIQRINRTDPIYRVKVFKNTSMFPEWTNTGNSIAGGLISHNHQVRKNEKEAWLWQQNTSVSQGHAHQVVWNASMGKLEILPSVGHIHTITY